MARKLAGFNSPKKVRAALQAALFNARENRLEKLDTTAPSITSSASLNVDEGVAFSLTLTSSESVSWQIIGGADQDLFVLTGADLTMEAKDYSNPVDDDANNVYVVQVRATDNAGNDTDQTINVTVNDVA